MLPEKATYSPWLADERFQSAFAQVVGNTLVDRLRAFEIWSLVRQSAKLTGGALIEVGVWRMRWHRRPDRGSRAFRGLAVRPYRCQRLPIHRRKSRVDLGTADARRHCGFG